MPDNRKNRSRRSSSDCTNPWYFISLSGFARAEGKDGTGKLFSLFSQLTGKGSGRRARTGKPSSRVPRESEIRQEFLNFPEGRRRRLDLLNRLEIILL